MHRTASVILVISLAFGMHVAAQSVASSQVQTVRGVAKAVSASSLTLTRGGRDITFRVERDTRFVGKGLASDLVLRWPPKTLADALKPGDEATVTFRKSGTRLIAVQVRIDRRNIGN